MIEILDKLSLCDIIELYSKREKIFLHNFINNLH